jgi:hypothetical protein
MIEHGLIAGHLLLGFGLLALVAAVLVIGLRAALRRHPPPRLYLRLHRVVAVLVLAEAAVGGLLFAAGKRPNQNLHLVYALAAILVMPVAISLASRDKSKARLYHVGGTVLLLGVLFRLVTTG